jgi:ABC-type multidrug transport system fused ATPase/permease subunit
MLILAILVMIIQFDVTTAYMTSTMALLAATAWKTLPAVSRILSSVTKIRGALPYIANQQAYLRVIEKQTLLSPNDDAKKIEFQEKLVFENVCFSYDASKKEALKNICFEIKKGETIGVIGTSGAGKSTLVDLLIGLLNPTKGRILLDGEPMNVDIIPSWLKIIGYVSQSPYIYDGTLAQNIAYGVENGLMDIERIRACCTMASMDDFLHDLSDHIYTSIGERGVRLSGGQRQRVAIARALYNDPEIIIFDEATSSLDRKSEKAIQKTIYSFKGKQTLIIIAHRLSTVSECDKILWIEKGSLKRSGLPGEIIARYKK